MTYFHLELDRHDALLAEGLACESYLDTGNRAAFEDAPAPLLHPDFAPARQAEAMAVWAAAGCAPIATDPADLRIRAAHLRLAARAALPAGTSRAIGTG